MQNNKTINIDNISITPALIQHNYEAAKYKTQTNIFLSEVFRMLGLVKIYQSNPSDRSLKEQIKRIVNCNFEPEFQDEERQVNIRNNLSQAFPLNKVGNFGRILQRKCKIHEKGLIQFQDGKLEKVKQIKNFINRVQKFGDRGIDEKIAWLEQNKKYPYRIVLIDKSEGHRAIYFSKESEAQYIRVALSQKYRLRADFDSIIKNGLNTHKNYLVELFKAKITNRNKMLNKSNRFSRKVLQNPINEGIERQDNTSLFYNMPNSNSNFNQFNPYRPKDDYNKLTTSNVQPYGNQTNKPPFNQSPNPSPFNKNLEQSRTIGRDPRQFSNPRSQYENNQRFDHVIEPRTNKHQNYLNKNNVTNKQREMDYKSGYARKDTFKEKDSYVRQFDNQIDFAKQQIQFHSIQFLTIRNLFFKPIVTVQLTRNNKIQQSLIFNTIIRSKDPNLLYQLLGSQQEENFVVKGHLKQYSIIFRVIDFLSNELVVQDKMSFQLKNIAQKTFLLCDNKLIKIELSIKNEKDMENAPYQQEIIELNKPNLNIQLKIPALVRQVKEQIHNYWQKDHQNQGYYNETNLTTFKILAQIQCIPLTWWRSIGEDIYEILVAIHNASRILGFKMIRSIVPLIRIFSKIYIDVEEMTEKILSFILTFGKIYYKSEYLNKIQKIHKIIGLEQDCDFISKVNLQISVIKKLTLYQCPVLFEKLERKNISFGFLIMEYIYEAFSRNFSKVSIIQLWNYLYQDLDSLQLNMILLSIAMIKYYEQDLMKIKRLKQFIGIFQSLKITKISSLIQVANNLKNKYFGESKGFLDEIKNIFNSKPFELVLADFYKNETGLIEKRKINKQIQKKITLRKVNKQVDIQIPDYPSKKYCLHIYFFKLPQIGGSLTLKCNDTNYQCLNHQKNRYFIIGEVSNLVQLTFLDVKSNQYSNQLALSQGVNQYTTYLTSSRSSTSYKVIYLAALLTDNQIQIFKKGKKFDHFICPYIKQMEFFQQINRPVQESHFLRKYDHNSNKDDIVKRIKHLFCYGNKNFNELEFYIQYIQSSELTLEEKFYMTKYLARKISSENCLSRNENIEKHVLKMLLQSTGYRLTNEQFECFYNDSLDYQFDAPKIIKCRYYPAMHNNIELKLEREAMKYYIDKTSKYLYADIIIDEFINFLKESINEQLGGFQEGQLKLLYSTNGQVCSKTWHLKNKARSKEVYYEQIKEDTVDDLEHHQIGDPQILMTEVLPSFAKISTILDYVNTNRNIDLKNKYQDKDRKKFAENINILKECHLKFRKIITMRHLNYPSQPYFPFFNYYYELTHQFSTPNIKNIIFNNLKSDLRTICLFNGAITFGENPKHQTFSYLNELGLYGNLRMLSTDVKTWYFFGNLKEEKRQRKQTGRVFVNYGYGVFRWEKCQILGYISKTKSTRRNGEKNNENNKQFLIKIKSLQKFVREYELELKEGALSRIQQISQNFVNDRSFYDANVQNKSESLKYLSKFIK